LLGWMCSPRDVDMTLLFDDVDIDEDDFVSPPSDLHNIVHPIHPGKITLTVFAGDDSVNGDFNETFKAPFLQMVAPPEDEIFDLYGGAAKYAAMGMEGVRFVWIGRECQYGNPFVAGKPDAFTYDYTNIDSLVRAVTDSIGASMRIGLGRTPEVMQCLEGFEYDTESDLESVWKDTGSVEIELSDTLAFEREKAMRLVVSGDKNGVARSTASKPDSNWADAGFTEFDFRGLSSKTNTSGRFFVASGLDSAYWDFSFPLAGAYQRKSFDLTTPDDSSTSGWNHANYDSVTGFGLIHLEHPSDSFSLLVDWMRLPNSAYFPYDSSLVNIRFDWWREDFCDSLLDHLGDTFPNEDFIFEGWNEGVYLSFCKFTGDGRG